MQPIPVTLPPAAYIGGKRLLAGRICPLLDTIDCTTYAEPFVGMGGVFLRRQRRPRVEVINDISADVVGLFRILNRHYVPFIDMLRYQLTTRADFDRLLQVVPDTLTDLERAARFLYLQRLAFGGKVAGRTFGVDPASRGGFDITRLVPQLEALHLRLAGVVIERLPWAELLRRYNKPATLFYLDPPYWGCEADYGQGVFARADFEAMASALKGLKGRFLLSINDRPEVRQTFAGLPMRPVRTRYSVAGHGRSKAVEELIIASSNALLGRLEKPPATPKKRLG
jgi:DNA adenine methylase